MKILISGAAGFIGYNLFQHLKSKGHDVYGFDNLSNSKPKEGIYQFDILDEKITEFIQSFNADVVIHLAAMGSIQKCKKYPLHCYLNNIIGFNNVFTALLGKPPQLFLYASSSSIYPEDLEPDDEEYSTRHELVRVLPDETMSLYGSTKLMNEMFGRMANANGLLKSIGLRFFNVFGPHQRCDVEYPAFIPTVIDSISKGKKLTLWNSGNNKRDYTPVFYVCDIVDRLLVKYKSFGESVLNVGYGEMKSSIDIVAKVESFLAKEALFEMKPPRMNEVETSEADVTLLNKLEVIKPDFDDCLKKTIEWYKGEYS